MSHFRIVGGKPLYGSVRVGGAKNASYKLMIASLLANGTSRLLNFSHISDVALVAQIINSLGGKAELVGERAYMIDPSGLSNNTIGAEYGEMSRASTMFIPVLLAKFGHAEVPFPGGDKIGARPLDRHFEGLEALGATVEVADGYIKMTVAELRGCTYRFKKNSHTGTETLIMAAVKAKGKTILENAAEETEIDDLIKFLNSMGAQIVRKPNRIIEINGVEELTGGIHKIMPDQNQVVSFACAALATKGDMIVEDAYAKDLTAFLDKLDEIGAGYEIGKYGIRFYYKGELSGTYVETASHPGFKTDWQPLWVTMMTQAHGESVLHETVYENRFAYVKSLNEMGAQIELFNPPVENPDQVYNFNLDTERPDQFHAARIKGPVQLHGGEFDVKDLRHGATLLIAGMIADGETILHDPDNHIDRGYEALDQSLQTMGAHIERY
jgi:UDP-N-acetylglucosamine 1-carboxyvinyltransferase